jgi:hypothetical protein
MSVPARQPGRAVYGADGRVAGTVALKVIPEGLPRKFAVSRQLAAGAFRRRPQVVVSASYRLSDVRVGDWVEVGYARIGDLDICYDLRIARRPGGQVPPAPGEDPDTPERSKYHVRMNEIQAREEKEKTLPPSERDPKVEVICRGLELVGGRHLMFYEEGPWYARLLIPPEGCPCPISPPRR